MLCRTGCIVFETRVQPEEPILETVILDNSMKPLAECRRPVLGFECGLVSGLSQSFLFNSYDRALYQSIVRSRPFLDRSNWKGNPFAGVSPSFLQRAFSSGLYFPLEDVFRRNVSSSYAVDGVLVGLVGGIFTTPFNSVKYAMWSSHGSIGKENVPKNPTTPRLVDTTMTLLREGGVSRLMRGAIPTLYRDVTFGLTFSVLRHEGDNGFTNNVLAAFVATAISSPFNYARMKVYSPDVIGQPQPTHLILHDLWQNTIREQRGILDQFKQIFRKLNIGWGALRVGLGMGIGSQIYNSCCR